MAGHAPDFWQKRGLLSLLVTPLSFVWVMIGGLRKMITPVFRSDRPVICIGNMMSGGTGKTPIAAAVAEAAIKRGWKPVILMRGYGGSAAGPLRVTAGATVAETGDEALWLARVCPVVISRDRAKGARLIAGDNIGDLIIMDDGMQNPGLYQDHLLVVFNGRTGFGNGRIIPAGPLREGLTGGSLQRADAVAISGDDLHGITARIKAIRPDLAIDFVPRQFDRKSLAAISGKPVIAFAGIGDNQGFFTMLKAAGADLVETHGFADHYRFTSDEIASLKDKALRMGAVLVTTEKDMTRLDAQDHAITAMRMNVEIPDLLLDKILPRR